MNVAGVYELPLTAPCPSSGSRATPAAGGLPEDMLVTNVLWLCRLRWIVVGALVLFGALGLSPTWLPGMGVLPHPDWPFAVAVALALANAAFLAHARRLRGLGACPWARANLLAQMVVDLLLLTAVVHFVGSLETYIAFAYLFHIVLACIFFTRPLSLAVTAIACFLYLACVAIEEARLVPRGGIYTDMTLRDHVAGSPGVRLVNTGWALLTWFVVWYLVSYLSATVRARDAELADSNRRLLSAQEERCGHMLRTTHELKAPFSAIDASVQVLLRGLAGPLSSDAQEILTRVSTRSRRLAAEIQEMLQLANLQSTVQNPPRREQIDLADMLRSCVAQMRPLAEERGIRIEEQIEPACVRGVEEYLRMLLANLLANAVAYSHRGGDVRVACSQKRADGPVVTIEDNGIGIPAGKLPHIFDEYYRTSEAAQHNRESTGLGLAIVRHVAQAHGIRVRVSSAPNAGTTFTLTFPEDPNFAITCKEKGLGLHTDC